MNNNINKTSKEIKKKLSFNDFTQSAPQQDVTPKEAHEAEGLAPQPPRTLEPTAPVYQHTTDHTPVMHHATSQRHTSQNMGVTPPAKQHVPTPAYQPRPHNVEPANPRHHYADQPAQQPTVPERNATTRQRVEQKVKVTYYLTDEDNNALTDIYIKRLQSRQKTDKSALISEAIKLLYLRENQEN